jgi:hypothetical protein
VTGIIILIRGTEWRLASGYWVLDAAEEADAVFDGEVVERTVATGDAEDDKTDVDVNNIDRFEELGELAGEESGCWAEGAGVRDAEDDGETAEGLRTGGVLVVDCEAIQASRKTSDRSVRHERVEARNNLISNSS